MRFDVTRRNYEVRFLSRTKKRSKIKTFAGLFQSPRSLSFSSDLRLFLSLSLSFMRAQLSLCPSKPTQKRITAKGKL